MPSIITVTAKATCYHPASGLHLTAGETYLIPETAFAADVFDRAEPDNKKPAKGGSK
jgi:hypothetical protein